MDGKCTKTPYNSIYETLNSKDLKQKSELVCCKHGKRCESGLGSEKSEKKNEQYVNLPSPSKEENMARKLCARLSQLELQAKLKKKSSNKEKRKKKKEPSEITATEVTTCSSAPINLDASLSSAKLGDAFNAYIGVFTSSEAESHVTRRGDFSLYHQFESRGTIDQLMVGLPLMLVYFTTTKKHRHYPIRTSKTDGELLFSVDCGYPLVRKHASLNQLVMYYSTASGIEIHPEDCYADSFSWWLE